MRFAQPLGFGLTLGTRTINMTRRIQTFISGAKIIHRYCSFGPKFHKLRIAGEKRTVLCAGEVAADSEIVSMPLYDVFSLFLLIDTFTLLLGSLTRIGGS